MRAGRSSVARPLRLGADEASALLVGLQMLTTVLIKSGPELADVSALNRVIAKLEAASGDAAALSSQVAVQVDSPGSAILACAQQALQASRRVHLSYYVPGRDEATERDVDPMRLLDVDGRTYLEGWCRRADGVRVFRLDRVLAVKVLAVAAEVPREAEPVDGESGLFRPSPTDLRVVIELSPYGRWVAEYYPCEEVADLGEGRLRVVLRTPDGEWVRRVALRLGEDGRVVGPAEVVADVHREAAAALARYGSGAGHPPVPTGEVS